MKNRNFLCITLLFLCHSAVRAQGVTEQFPPLSLGAQNPQTAPQINSQPSTSVPDPAGIPLTPLAPVGDPAFGPALTNIPWPAVATTPEEKTQAAPLTGALADDTETGEDEVVDTGIATPIAPPPTGEPVHIEANQQSKTGDITRLDGDILIVYRTYRIRADHATYDQAHSVVMAEGHLALDGGPSNEHLRADRGVMNLNEHTGHFYNVTGTLGVKPVTHSKYVFTAPNPFTLQGREVMQLGPGRYEVLHGSITSCRLTDPDWRLLADKILVDDKVAHAKNTVFTFFHMPLFYLPYVSHPVETQERQSGILLPIFGNDTQKGFIVGEAGYVVLGRSADATFGSEYFSRRGFAPFGNFRYKGVGENFATFRFRALLDRLPEAEQQGGVDLILDTKRQLTPHTRAVADIDYLSNYVYRLAFEENFSAAINSEVKSDAYLTHEQDGFSESVRVARYQNFLSSTQGDEIRVLHTPELYADAVEHPLGHTPLTWGGEASASALSRSEPGFQTSRMMPRIDMFPHLTLPLSAGGWTLRSQAGVRETFYGKSQDPGLPGNTPLQELGANINRLTFNSDVQLHTPTLERDFDSPLLRRFLHGAEMRHTVEPELSWHYVTGVNDFAHTLRFDTTDVLADTNEVEYGLTQRVFLRHLHPKPCKGDEALGPSDTCGGGTVDWLDWTVAQRHYFNRDFGGAVVPGERNVFSNTLDFSGIAFVTNPRSESPIQSRLRIRTTSATDLEWDLDYDARHGRIQGSNVFATLRRGNYFFSLGDSRLFSILPVTTTTLPEAPAPVGTVAAAPATVQTTGNGLSNFNQLRLAAVYGSPLKHGLSAGMNVGYDFTLQTTQYFGAQAAYNRNCCGLAMEVRRYSLGVVRDDTQYLYSFTFAGIGSVGSLNALSRVF